MAGQEFRLPHYHVHDDEFGALAEVPESWAMAACEVDALRDLGDGDGITVGVLDTGIDPDHPMFAGRILNTRSFISGEDAFDFNQHGTHVAGTVAAADKKIGVATRGKLNIAKVLSNRGSGPTSGITEGVKWLDGLGCHVITASLGGGGRDAQMSAALAAFVARGGIFTAAAGNSRPQPVDFPGSDPSSLANAACNRQFQIASFSSIGLTNTTIAMTCPGVDITSCKPGGGYQTMSGTSMATPFGAGIVACILSIFLKRGHPLPNAAWFRNFFYNWSVDKGIVGLDRDFGPGIINCRELARFFGPEMAA